MVSAASEGENRDKVLMSRNKEFRAKYKETEDKTVEKALFTCAWKVKLLDEKDKKRIFIAKVYKAGINWSFESDLEMYRLCKHDNLPTLIDYFDDP
jgi:hypothetical protein